MNSSKYFHKNMIITGIPRSGTSLFCKIANAFDNVVVLNEVLYDIDTLPGAFFELRDSLIRGDAIPNRFDKKGELTSNTMKHGENLENRRIHKKYSEDCIVGSKVNAPYMFQLDKLIINRFNIFGIIRHPYYVIGSYQMPWTSTLNIANPFTDPRYKDFEFQGKTKIEAQAELWEYFACIMIQKMKSMTIYKYEDITGNTEEVLTDFIKRMEIQQKIPKELPEIKNMNNPSRYKNMDEIEEAVSKYCNSMDVFGYEL